MARRRIEKDLKSTEPAQFNGLSLSVIGDETMEGGSSLAVRIQTPLLLSCGDMPTKAT